MSVKMKTLFDYLEAITPALSDNQRRHIKMLVDDMVGNAAMIEKGIGWKEGLLAGRKLERATWSGWAPDDLVAKAEPLEDE